MEHFWTQAASLHWLAHWMTVPQAWFWPHLVSSALHSVCWHSPQSCPLDEPPEPAVLEPAVPLPAVPLPPMPLPAVPLPAEVPPPPKGSEPPLLVPAVVEPALPPPEPPEPPEPPSAGEVVPAWPLF